VIGCLSSAWATDKDKSETVTARHKRLSTANSLPTGGAEVPTLCRYVTLFT
jgi:hypothetical protein